MRRIFAFTLLFAFSVLLIAQTPRKVHFQGTIYSDAGMPVTGTHSMTVSIFEAHSGGVAIWSETHPSVTFDSEGSYSIMIGEVEPLTISFDRQLWLGMSLDGEDMDNRIEFGASAYSLSSVNTIEGVAPAANGNFSIEAGTNIEIIGMPDSNKIRISASGTVPNPLVLGGSARMRAGDDSRLTTVPSNGKIELRTIADELVVLLSAQPDSTQGIYSATTSLSALASIRGVNKANTIGAIGILGESQATNAGVFGVVGSILSKGSHSAGVAGEAAGDSGATYGVYGITNSVSDSSAGVFGETRIADIDEGGVSYGVWGVTGSAADNSAGVYGVAYQDKGLTYGVYGSTNSKTLGTAGVYGEAMVDSGAVAGVVGSVKSKTNGATGVYGEAAGDSGATSGVYGATNSVSDSSAGVFGETRITDIDEGGVSYGVWGITGSAADNSAGVFGVAYQDKGLTYGVYGSTNSKTLGTAGVYGEAVSDSGAVTGVIGSVKSKTNGATGVYGEAAGDSGATCGVYGATNSVSDSCAGVFGETRITDTGEGGISYGVWGLTGSATDNSAGVLGVTYQEKGMTYGVYGSTNSKTLGTAGVYGEAVSDSGAVTGVIGSVKSNTSGAIGVYGEAAGDSGATYGVYGASNSVSDSTAGVFGETRVTDIDEGGVSYGVWGLTGSATDNSAGVYGEAQADTGDVCGVFGKTKSPTGYGVWGYATDLHGETYGVAGLVNSDNSKAAAVFGMAMSANAAAIMGAGNLLINNRDSEIPIFKVDSDNEAIEIYNGGSVISTFGGPTRRVAIQKVNGSATPTIPDNGFGIEGEAPIIVSTGTHGVTISCAECGGCSCPSLLTVGTPGTPGIIQIPGTSTTPGTYAAQLHYSSSDNKYYIQAGGFGVNGKLLLLDSSNEPTFMACNTGAVFMQGATVYGVGGLEVNGPMYATGTKSFRVPHPEQPDKEITFYCTESDKVLIETINVIDLIDGYAELALPHEFVLMAERGTYSVLCTPQGFDNNGVGAMVDENGSKLIVKELGGGKHSFKVAFSVRAVRVGYKDAPVVSPKHEPRR